MRNLFAKLWKDDDGIVTIEYLILATVVGLSLVVGANVLAFSLNTEMAELAGAVSTLDQDYSYSGMTGQFQNGNNVSGRTGVNPNDQPDSTDVDEIGPQHSPNIDINP
jgi:Flp pilus assembly pilin Flp